MALSFLSEILPIAKDVIGLGTGLYNIFGGSSGEEALRTAGRESMGALERAREYTDAAIDPSNPLFQKLASEETSAINRDFIGALKDIMTQSARQRAMGRPGFFVNPERRDEAVARAIAARKQTAFEQARQSARNYLLTAAAANRATGGAYVSAAAPAAQASELKMSRIGGGLETVYDTLSNITSAMARPRQSTSEASLLNGSQNFQGLSGFTPSNNPVLS